MERAAAGEHLQITRADGRTCDSGPPYPSRRCARRPTAFRPPAGPRGRSASLISRRLPYVP
jgi:hypothetical protein